MKKLLGTILALLTTVFLLFPTQAQQIPVPIDYDYTREYFFATSVENTSDLLYLSIILTLPLQNLFVTGFSTSYVTYLSQIPNETSSTGILNFFEINTLHSNQFNWINQWDLIFNWMVYTDLSWFKQQLSHYNSIPTAMLPFNFTSVLSSNFRGTHEISFKETGTMFGFEFSATIEEYQADNAEAYQKVMSIYELQYFDKKQGDLVNYHLELEVNKEKYTLVNVEILAKNYDFGIKSGIYLYSVKGLLVALFPSIFTLWFLYDSMYNTKKNRFKGVK